jgi:hypothetical protein
MKLSEHIKELQKLDPNLEVYMAADGEGNSYRPIGAIGKGFIAKIDGGPTFFDTKKEFKNYSREYGADDDTLIPVVCIWPGR